MKDNHDVNDLKVGMWCVCDANLALVVKINAKKATIIQSIYNRYTKEYFCLITPVFPYNLIALTEDENFLPPLVRDRIPSILKTYSEYQARQQKTRR